MYEDAAPGSFASWWWESFEAPAGRYVVQATRGELRLETSFDVALDEVLPTPALSLDLAGGWLSWWGAEGAQSYLCRVLESTGTVVVFEVTSGLDCSVASLGPGTYRAEVIAHSIDHVALAKDLSPAPLSGDAHLLSRSVVQFSAPNPGGSGAAARLVGGSITYGSLLPGLALWLSLDDGAGAPLVADVSLEIVGPGIPAGTPILGTYPAGSTERLLWDYLSEPMAGTYSARLQAPGLGLDFIATFETPLEIPLAEPSGVVVTPAPSGAAMVTWDSVPEAAAYLASAWTTVGASYLEAAAGWTTDTAFAFPMQTFTSGTTYDV